MAGTIQSMGLCMDGAHICISMVPPFRLNGMVDMGEHHHCSFRMFNRQLLGKKGSHVGQRSSLLRCFVFIRLSFSLFLCTHTYAGTTKKR